MKHQFDYSHTVLQEKGNFREDFEGDYIPSHLGGGLESDRVKIEANRKLMKATKDIRLRKTVRFN